MVRVAPINIAFNPRTLWFDPRDLEISKGDPVVVTTARGIEFGRAASDVIEVDEREVKALKTPLKPVKRLATPEDVERAEDLERRSREALPEFKAMAAEAHADMHPVSVEFLFDGDKAVFYFEAEERVDFRDLVRKLASRFQVRVDMRQIGVRDEARIVGGIGHCGQIVCCKRLGGEFKPVSIRMAKAQDLSLNPQKISGLCGRLMCCLRYENEAYKDFKARAPKAGAMVETPDGPAKVDSLDVPREQVKVRVEGEKPVSVPLAAFEEVEEGKRPNIITAEGWDEATSPAPTLFEPGLDIFSTSKFTGSDKLGGGSAIHNEGKAADPLAPKKSRKRRRSQKVSATSDEGTSASKPKKRTSRRSTKIQAGKGTSSPSKGESQEKQGKSAQGSKRGKRPGQRSSGLAHEGKGKPSEGGKPKAPQGSKQGQAEGQEAGQGQAKRRRRRRRKPASATQAKGQGGAQANSANGAGGNSNGAGPSSGKGGAE